MIDGLGAWRIVSAWDQLSADRTPLPTDDAFTARRATFEDATTLHEWRNDPETRAHSRTQGEVAWHDHLAWLTRVLDSADRQLFIVEANGEAIGTVRWDRRGPVDWEVSITVAPHRRGQRLALPLLLAGETALEAESPVRLIAAVHTDNPASRRLFVAAGYLPQLPRRRRRLRDQREVALRVEPEHLRARDSQPDGTRRDLQHVPGQRRAARDVAGERAACARCRTHLRAVRQPDESTARSVSETVSPAATS